MIPFVRLCNEVWVKKLKWEYYKFYRSNKASEDKYFVEWFVKPILFNHEDSVILIGYSKTLSSIRESMAQLDCFSYSEQYFLVSTTFWLFYFGCSLLLIAPFMEVIKMRFFINLNIEYLKIFLRFKRLEVKLSSIFGVKGSIFFK